MMKYGNLLICGLLLTTFAGGAALAEDKAIKMSTTTSTQESGLLDVLLPALQKDTGITLERTLREIARGEAKKSLRGEIIRLPADCSGCSDAAGCKGGCRGRGLVESGSLDSPDPACGYGIPS